MQPVDAPAGTGLSSPPTRGRLRRVRQRTPPMDQPYWCRERDGSGPKASGRSRSNGTCAVTVDTARPFGESRAPCPEDGLSRQYRCRERPLHMSIMRRETTAETTTSNSSHPMSPRRLRNHPLASTRRDLSQRRVRTCAVLLPHSALWRLPTSGPTGGAGHRQGPLWHAAMRRARPSREPVQQT